MSDLKEKMRSAGGDGDAIHCWNMAVKGADRIAELEAALRVEKADAERWREFSKGEPLTVKMKKSTVVFGPNPEREYAEALSTAIDKLLKD